MPGLWSVSLSLSHTISSLQTWAEGSHLCISEPASLRFHGRAPREAAAAARVRTGGRVRRPHRKLGPLTPVAFGEKLSGSAVAASPRGGAPWSGTCPQQGSSSGGG